MTSNPAKLTFGNGVEMPALGLGVYQSSPEDTTRAVSAALACGYRLIDTAAAYGNEAQVGEALRQSEVGPRDVFVTTKLWISDYGYGEALHGFERSMRKLGLDTLDLYLLQRPGRRRNGCSPKGGRARSACATSTRSSSPNWSSAPASCRP